MAKTLADLQASITDLEKVAAETKAAVQAALIPVDLSAEAARVDAVKEDLKTFVPPVV